MTLTAIRHISAANGVDSIASMPVHMKGDILVAFAFIDGSATPPALPAGWTNGGTQAGTSCAMRMGWIKATSASMTSGTWTTATSLVIGVYRGALRTGTPIGTPVFGTGSTLAYTVPALTIAEHTALSWGIHAIGFRAGDVTLNTPLPSGLSARTYASDATDEVQLMDTNGQVPTGTLASVGATPGAGTASAWVSCSVELLSDPLPETVWNPGSKNSREHPHYQTRYHVKLPKWAEAKEGFHIDAPFHESVVIPTDLVL